MQYEFSSWPGRELRKQLQVAYEPSRSRVDAVSEKERKRSLNLQIDLLNNFGSNVPWKLHTKREII